MSEQRCGTCARWDGGSNIGTGNTYCGFIGRMTAKGAGTSCRAYRPKGQKTVRVRINVWTGPNGAWAAQGSHVDATGVLANAYIEADIPLPESVTVEGEVVS